jgi:hypothetical protein
MISEFKLSNSRLGIYHFGYVKLKVKSSSKTQIINSISKPVNINNGEVDEIICPTWFDAAIDGINEALSYINQDTTQLFVVEIICIKGVEVDTKADDIRVSAFMATIKAIVGEDIYYRLERANEQWNIIFEKQ